MICDDLMDPLGLPYEPKRIHSFEPKTSALLLGRYLCKGDALLLSYGPTIMTIKCRE